MKPDKIYDLLWLGRITFIYGLVTYINEKERNVLIKKKEEKRN